MKINREAGPAPTPARAMAAISNQRKDILDLLAVVDGPGTVDELAAVAGLHANTVRGHLDGLVEQGLATREAERTGGRGRPSWRYAVVRERVEGAPEYVGLAMALAEQIAAISPDPSAAARVAGERWAASIPGSGDQTEDVVSLLADLGFDPIQDGSDILLRECPILSAARRTPEVVCAVHEGLIRARLADGEQGRLEAFAGPGYCQWHGTGNASRGGGGGVGCGS